MFSDIKLFNIASAMARHAAERHQIISQNIANADTNGYKAKDLEPFIEAFERVDSMGDVKQMRSMNGGPAKWRVMDISASGLESPNGNTVSLEDQMMRSIEAQQNHEAATTIYKKAMGILRLSLGRNV